MDVLCTVVADLACSTSARTRSHMVARVTHDTMRPMQSAERTNRYRCRTVSGLPIFYAFHMSRSRNCYRSTLLPRPDAIILGREKPDDSIKKTSPETAKRAVNGRN